MLVKGPHVHRIDMCHRSLRLVHVFLLFFCMSHQVNNVATSFAQFIEKTIQTQTFNARMKFASR